MRWEVETGRLRVPWRLAAVEVLDHSALPDGRFRWLVECAHGSRKLLRMLPGVLSVEPSADPRGEWRREMAA